MKIIYILLVLVIVASALGCVGKKPAESTSAPVSGLSDNGDPGIESDLTQIDSMMNESAMDISLPEVNADAFT